MDLTSILNTTTNYGATQAAADTAAAERLSSNLKNVNNEYTREELEEAAKSFEAYFVEQVMKQVKENEKLFSGDDDDQIMSQYTDFYLDATISDLAKQIVDDYGGTFTDAMVEQMARNYGIDLDEKET